MVSQWIYNLIKRRVYPFIWKFKVRETHCLTVKGKLLWFFETMRWKMGAFAFFEIRLSSMIFKEILWDGGGLFIFLLATRCHFSCIGSSMLTITPINLDFIFDGYCIILNRWKLWKIHFLNSLFHCETVLFGLQVIHRCSNLILFFVNILLKEFSGEVSSPSLLDQNCSLSLSHPFAEKESFMMYIAINGWILFREDDEAVTPAEIEDRHYKPTFFIADMLLFLSFCFCLFIFVPFV